MIQVLSKMEVSQKSNKGVLIVLVVAVGAAAFFAGMYFSNIGDANTVTKEEFDAAILDIESKINNVQQPTNQPRPVKISLDDDPIRGDVNAPITILEFSDYQCPFCARFYAQTLPALMETYIDTGIVKLVYRDFPIQSIHPNAMPAAVAAECADDQGMYWEYHDMLFENQKEWSSLEITDAVNTFKQYANRLGLSESFDLCLDSGKYLDEVRNDLADGRAYDVTGTPAFFVGNDIIGYVKLNGAQPFEAFQQVINSQLNS